MNQNQKISLLPFAALVLGLLGGWLWHLMDGFCREEGGLLTPWNLPAILLGLLSMAFCAGVVWYVHRSGQCAGSHRWNAPAAPALAVGILWAILTVPDPRQDVLSAVHRALGLLAAVCLLPVGAAHWRRKQPNFLLYALLCCFFGIHMAQQYRIWSSDPQTADYLYQILACVGLTLTAYHRTAISAGMEKGKWHTAISLMTAFFSMTCLFIQGMGLFYLTGGLWAAALPPVPGKNCEEGESL